MYWDSPWEECTCQPQGPHEKTQTHAVCMTLPGLPASHQLHEEGQQKYRCTMLPRGTDSTHDPNRTGRSEVMVRVGPSREECGKRNKGEETLSQWPWGFLIKFHLNVPCPNHYCGNPKPSQPITTHNVQDRQYGWGLFYPMTGQVSGEKVWMDSALPGGSYQSGVWLLATEYWQHAWPQLHRQVGSHGTCQLPS